MRKFLRQNIFACTICLTMFILLPLIAGGCRGFYDPASINVDNYSLQKEIVKDRERLGELDKNFKSLEQLVLNNQCKCPKDMVSCTCGADHKKPDNKPKVLGWYKDTAKENTFYYGYVQDTVLYYSYLYHPEALAVKHDFDKVAVGAIAKEKEVK